MTQAAVPGMPGSKAVRDLLEGLLERDVRVSPTQPLVPSPRVPSAVAVYVDARLRAGAVVALDLPLAAICGAAIGLVPAGGARQCVQDGALTPAISENLHEVLNVVASLFARAGGRPLRLYAVYAPSDLPPADISAFMRTLGRRMDLLVNIAGYGTGTMGVVLT